MAAVLGSVCQDADDEPNRRPVEILRLCTTVGDTRSKATIKERTHVPSRPMLHAALADMTNRSPTDGTSLAEP